MHLPAGLSMRLCLSTSPQIMFITGRSHTLCSRTAWLTDATSKHQLLTLLTAAARSETLACRSGRTMSAKSSCCSPRTP